VDASSAPLKTITTELMSFVLAKLLIISATVEVFCPTAKHNVHWVQYSIHTASMMSSRWPRPIGIMASTAVIPVAKGSCTDLRSIMLGARDSNARGSLPSSVSPLAIDWCSHRVDNPSTEGFPDLNIGHLAGVVLTTESPLCMATR
jgi:hypothetical protein